MKLYKGSLLTLTDLVVVILNSYLDGVHVNASDMTLNTNTANWNTLTLVLLGKIS